jgi:hypothetical protein
LERREISDANIGYGVFGKGKVIMLEQLSQAIKVFNRPKAALT